MKMIQAMNKSLKEIQGNTIKQLEKTNKSIKESQEKIKK